MITLNVIHLGWGFHVKDSSEAVFRFFFCFCHSNESNQRQSNMFASSVTMRYVFLSVNPFTNDPSLSITHTHTHTLSLSLLVCFHEWLRFSDSKTIFTGSHRYRFYVHAGMPPWWWLNLWGEHREVRDNTLKSKTILANVKSWCFVS